MKNYKTTTPSRRQMTGVDYGVLTVSKPFKPLIAGGFGKAGRNHHGRITVRHQGGGNKKLYRLVDFRQDKMNVPGRVETIEYDPYRTAFIALVLYKDGERRYILAPQGLRVGNTVLSSDSAPFEVGMRTPLKRIPVGTFVHNVEILIGRGGQLGRAAGTSLQVLANEDKCTHLKMPSGEIRKVSGAGYASIGQVSNSEHNLVVF